MSVSPQKRKAESASLATQASPATPVPSLPDSAEASQGSAYPAGRHGNAFNNKGRDDHDPLSLLTTVRGGGPPVSVCPLTAFSQTGGR